MNHRERRERILRTEENKLTDAIIGAAIEVHKALGPGLLESIYRDCLAYELTLCGIPFEKECPVPLTYKGISFDCGFRIDLRVAQSVIIELKAVETLLPVHTSQIITYLKLTDCHLGLLINFNVRLLKDGINRIRVG